MACPVQLLTNLIKTLQQEETSPEEILAKLRQQVQDSGFNVTGANLMDEAGNTILTASSVETLEWVVADSAISLLHRMGLSIQEAQILFMKGPPK